MSWRNRPKQIHQCPKGVDAILFIDESGNPSLKAVKKHLSKETPLDEGEAFFSICGCIIKRDDLKTIADNIVELKKKYWEDGCFQYKNEVKRVCFHSYEIRKFKDAFNSAVINRDAFLTELSSFMSSVPMTITSAAIDKVEYLKKYPNGSPIRE